MSWLHSTGGKFFRGGFRAGSGSFQAGVVEKGGEGTAGTAGGRARGEAPAGFCGEMGERS